MPAQPSPAQHHTAETQAQAGQAVVVSVVALQPLLLDDAGLGQQAGRGLAQRSSLMDNRRLPFGSTTKLAAQQRADVARLFSPQRVPGIGGSVGLRARRLEHLRGVHGEQAAEHPGQGQHAAAQTQDVVPAGETLAIGRARATLVAAPETPAHTPATEDGEPMQPGAQPAPAALGEAGVTHHLAGGAAGVQPALRLVGHRHAVEGAVRVHCLGVGPGVVLHPRQQLGRRILRKVARSRERLIRTDARNAPSAARIAEDVARLARCTAQAPLAGVLQARGLQSLRHRHAAGLPVQRRQTLHLLGRRQLGVADGEHEHAGQDSQRHHQAERNAGPAVQQIEEAFHGYAPFRST
ncbi:hypothetical protein C1O66_12415 [Paucibacter aquatile]|uniref:Uncharacterized protein n=1 Tax=Kinneretia aquatilis TaxID=2070761 RepID=A0A2N8KXQ2_9BURK|nr:hypothetical protein C1O66_12415 [Paucibacter aquatile]